LERDFHFVLEKHKKGIDRGKKRRYTNKVVSNRGGGQQKEKQLTTKKKIKKHLDNAR
jgi:hypothetical protein